MLTISKQGGYGFYEGKRVNLSGGERGERIAKGGGEIYGSLDSGREERNREEEEKEGRWGKGKY